MMLQGFISTTATSYGGTDSSEAPKILTWISNKGPTQYLTKILKKKGFSQSENVDACLRIQKWFEHYMCEMYQFFKEKIDYG